MLCFRNPAPAFNCDAVIDGEVVPLDWNRIHTNRTLILLFDSIDEEFESGEHLWDLHQAAEEFENLDASVAVVCRDSLFDVLMWNERWFEETWADRFAFPLLVDSDQRIASLYEMLDSGGHPLWGSAIIDADGIVRQITAGSVPVGVNIDELLRCVQALDAIKDEEDLC